jgi:hypothetical protein
MRAFKPAATGLLVGLAIQLQKRLSLHSQLHLRVALENLRITLPEQLGHPLVCAHSSGAHKRPVCKSIV